MNYSIRPISAEDREPVMAIFNHYVEHSFAVYPVVSLPDRALDLFLQMSRRHGNEPHSGAVLIFRGGRICTGSF